MALIKTSEEIKKYISVDGSFNYDTLIPYVELAENQVKSILGKEQFQELNDYYNSESTGITELDALLPYAQRPVIYFAFLKGLDKINVSIGNNGIGIIQNANLAPASKDRVDKLRKNIEESAWDSLEYLLRFIEENSSDYPLWEASGAYNFQYNYLINSAQQFDENYKINRSRLTFLNWRPTMGDVEKLQIEPQISEDFLNELKAEIKANNVSAANQKVLPFLRKALAYLTAAIEEEPKMQITGEKYLMMAKSIMDKTPVDYPIYTASDVYDETIKTYQTFENDPELHIVSFGV